MIAVSRGREYWRSRAASVRVIVAALGPSAGAQPAPVKTTEPSTQASGPSPTTTPAPTGTPSPMSTPSPACPAGQTGTPPNCVRDANRGSILPSQDRLNAGEYLRSSDGHYRLVMQGDGNLVEYDAAGVALWSSATADNPGAWAGIQGDGNLVVYTSANRALWSSGTDGHVGAFLALQPDANLVVYSAQTTPLWSNGAYDDSLEGGELLVAGQYLQSRDRRYSLVMQGDGNLVLYGPDGAAWSSQTNSNSGAWVQMQYDGNAVVYAADRRALWSSGTAGNDGAHLIVQSDGNLVVYGPAALWDSHSAGGGGHAPGTTGAQQTAIAWARSYADAHSHTYIGLCLSFVFDAYAHAGINLRPWVNYAINGNTYPSDIWGRFTHGSTGTGTPPAGALVFWIPRNGDRTNSHVALSLGGGNLVSTSDSVDESGVHYETIAQHAYAVYQGWWLPDQ
ncbi:MAG TPA: hypothetical protein VI300_05450 [Solirubrobacter sp.]